MDLRELGERKAISRLRGSIGGTDDLGMGEDDCAVVSLGGDELLLASTDLVLDSSHILPGATPMMIGRFAVEIAVSDVAAMGGSPIGVLCGYAMPSHTDIHWLEGVSRGMAEAAGSHDTSILGGDTKASPEPTIAVTALGTVNAGECMYRGGAKVGDQLVLTGPMGGPALGYNMDPMPDGALTDTALDLVYGVSARVRAGRVMAASEHTHACIDLSDGFAPCLHQLLEASSKGAQVRWNDIPLVDGLEDHAYIRDRDLRELALHWGGEYELMAAVDPQGAGPLVQDLVHLGLEPAIVGTVTEGRKTIIIDDSGREVLRPHGFDHFQG